MNFSCELFVERAVIIGYGCRAEKAIEGFHIQRNLEIQLEDHSKSLTVNRLV